MNGNARYLGSAHRVDKRKARSEKWESVPKETLRNYLSFKVLVHFHRLSQSSCCKIVVKIFLIPQLLCQPCDIISYVFRTGADLGSPHPWNRTQQCCNANETYKMAFRRVLHRQRNLPRFFFPICLGIHYVLQQMPIQDPFVIAFGFRQSTLKFRVFVCFLI